MYSRYSLVPRWAPERFRRRLVVMSVIEGDKGYERKYPRYHRAA